MSSMSSMSSRNLSRSLLSERARDILVLLTDGHPHLPPGGTQSSLQPHLPEVRISAQYFIDMGLRSAAAEHLLVSFWQFTARYQQIFELYFSRAIQGHCLLPPAYYHDTFVAQFKRIIQSWASQIVSAVQVQICQTALSPNL